MKIKKLVNLITTSPFEFNKVKMFNTSLNRYFNRDFDIYQLSELYHENTKIQKGIEKNLASSVETFRQADMLKITSQILPTYSSSYEIFLPVKKNGTK